MRDALDRWLFKSFSVTPEGLALYRIAFALFTLLFVAPGHGARGDFSFIGSLPASFFDPPPGPMGLFADFLSPMAAGVLEGLLVFVLAMLLVGYGTRVMSILTSVLFLVGYGFYFSVGTVHPYLLFILLPLVMSASNWGAAYSLDAVHGRTRRAVESWPLTLLALLTGFTLFTAGIAMALGGGLDPTFSAIQQYATEQFFARGRQDMLAPLLLQIDYGTFWIALDYFAVALGIALLAVAHPRLTHVMLAAAVVAHFALMMTINISGLLFLIVYAAFLDWDTLARRLPDERFAGWSYTFQRLRPIGVFFGAVVWAFFYFAGSPLLWLGDLALSSDLVWAEVIAVTGGIFVVIALGGRALRKRPGKERPG